MSKENPTPNPPNPNHLKTSEKPTIHIENLKAYQHPLGSLGNDFETSHYKNIKKHNQIPKIQEKASLHYK